MVVEIISIITLGLIIIALLVDRFYANREHNKLVKRLTGALFSRNITDYLAVTKDEPVERDVPSEPEDVEISDLDDAEFDKFVAKN